MYFEERKSTTNFWRFIPFCTQGKHSMETVRFAVAVVVFARCPISVGPPAKTILAAFSLFRELVYASMGENDAIFASEFARSINRKANSRKNPPIFRFRSGKAKKRIEA